jgi:hypothetical protein
MEIYFKQSVGCAYKDLREKDYKAYTYYDKGQTLVADHPQCTHSQINQGYAIEFVIVAILASLGFGFIERQEAQKSNVFGIAAGAAVMALVVMLILNLVIMLLPLVASVAIGLSVLAGCVWLTSRTINPLEMWREYQAEKERLAQKRLREAQAEINRLRASDPNLNEALKSLDAMTTALHD